ncbi:MAG: purple acid phosphatase family protein [Steroidobacteraceae bacterium]
MSDFAVTRRDALKGLGGLALSAALSGAAAAADSGARSLSFLAVGDWGRKGAYHQRDVAIQMGECARELNARFVVSVGDNFYEDGVASVEDPLWRESFEQVYDAPSLQVPWHVALGNHDYRGSVAAQIAYSAISNRWRMPARWYSFEERAPDGTVVELFVTDTTPMVKRYYGDLYMRREVEGQKVSVPLQLAWLDRALARSQADWKIVVGHHPVYSRPTGHGIEGLMRGPHLVGVEIDAMPDLVAAIDPILQRHRVPLYLNGHLHDLQHVHGGVTDFVCTGAGSKLGDFCFLGGGDFCALQSGFVACTVTRERLRVVYRDRTGARLDVVEIQRAS